MDLLEIDELGLYFGDPYVINDNISVLQPSIGEIAQYGERKYFSVIHTIKIFFYVKNNNKKLY